MPLSGVGTGLLRPPPHCPGIGPAFFSSRWQLLGQGAALRKAEENEHWARVVGSSDQRGPVRTEHSGVSATPFGSWLTGHRRAAFCPTTCLPAAGDKGAILEEQPFWKNPRSPQGTQAPCTLSFGACSAALPPVGTPSPMSTRPLY